MIQISITLQSPFLIGGLEQANQQLDSMMLRDASGKFALFPGSAIKGLLRDAFNGLAALGHPAFADATLIDRWFGAASSKTSQNLPSRAKLSFGDLTTVEEIPNNDSRYARVAIDVQSGSAKEGALQFIELAWPVGKTVEFAGTIVGDFGMPAPEAATLIKQALEAIPSIGSMRGNGFGKVVRTSAQVRVEHGSGNPTAAGPDLSNTAGLFDLAIFVRPNGPFVVAADRLDKNSFAGSDIIPGAAIKGALADRLEGNSAALGMLSALVISHACPMADAEAEQIEAAYHRALPRSIAAVPGTQAGSPPVIIDMIDQADALLIDRADREPVTPLAFAPDWKSTDETTIEKIMAGVNGWTRHSPARIQRTRAAIDGDKGTAVEQQLFSQDAACPFDDEGNALLWGARISGSIEHVRSILPHLVGQRFSFGKLATNAEIVAVHAVPRRSPPSVQETEDGATAIIILEADALIPSFSRLDRLKGSVEAAYAEYFASLSRGLTLTRFFATQRLITGYQAVRFRANEHRFEPWVATTAGSVFKLTLDEAHGGAAKLGELLSEWVLMGLPPDCAPTAEPWRHIPLPRENGYGRIANAPIKVPPLPAGWQLVEPVKP